MQGLVHHLISGRTLTPVFVWTPIWMCHTLIQSVIQATGDGAVRMNCETKYFPDTTGVNQKVLPVLSTETLLHIWLSTEYYGFRPSSTAVDTVS